MAKGGRGNDRIVNTTMHWFFKNPEKLKDTFVSIGWTTGYRWDYVRDYVTPTHDREEESGVIIPNNHKDAGINGELLKFDYQWGTWQLFQYDFFKREKDMDLELTCAVKLYTNILSLQYFLKYHDIPYVFYHALINDLPENEVNGNQRPDLKLLKDQIDQRHFYNFNTSNVEKDNVQSHYEFCAMNGWTKSANDGHPSETGHHRWADNLNEFVKQNNLLDRPSLYSGV